MCTIENLLDLSLFFLKFFIQARLDDEPGASAADQPLRDSPRCDRAGRVGFFWAIEVLDCGAVSECILNICGFFFSSFLLSSHEPGVHFALRPTVC